MKPDLASVASGEFRMDSVIAHPKPSAARAFERIVDDEAILSSAGNDTFVPLTETLRVALGASFEVARRRSPCPRRMSKSTAMSRMRSWHDPA